MMITSKSKEPSVLIISTPTDGHLPYVTKYLEPREYILVDAQEIIAKKGLSYHISAEGEITVLLNNQLLSNIKGVWLRRPLPVEKLDISTEKRFVPYIRSALSAHILQLYTLFPNANWMSDYYAIRRANNKFFQLQMATKVGLRTPASVFTSDPIVASQFLREREATIIKSLANRSPADVAGRPQIMLATKFMQSEELDFSGLHVAPAIFQDAILHQSDIRVTVIGNRVFAASIVLKDAKHHPKTRDWRLGYIDGTLAIQPFDLPLSLEQQCLQLVQQLGLNYGAIDFVQDTNGDIWFLEINPNGQWAFVEKETGQPMGKAVADFLRG